MSRRWWNNGWWWRQWRKAVWCAICLLCLATLAIRDTLHFVLPLNEEFRTRRCHPPSVSLDGCGSWRPLVVKHPVCGCTRSLLVLHDECADLSVASAGSYLTYTQEIFGNSTCSDEATLRGPNQHVISISSEISSIEDLETVNRTLYQATEAYKGWVLRLYTQVTPENREDVCSLVCSNPTLDLCDVSRLATRPQRNTGWIGWRWAVLGDPLVAAWAVRYTGRMILHREAHALTQFINSDKCWHLMRDHSSHVLPAIGSGLLGGKTSWGFTELHNVRSQLIHKTKNIENEERMLEQLLLPVMSNDAMTHDSVACRQSLGSVPFPTRRHAGEWVGMPNVKIQRNPVMPSRQSGSPSQENHIQQNLLSKLAKNEEATEPNDRHQPPQEKDGHTDVGLKSRRSRETEKERPLPQDSAKEAEINAENGIPVCPYSCRPQLHPDWDYC